MVSKITKIEEQKNNSERVNLYIDNTFFMGAYKEVVFRLRIKQGSEVNQEQLKEVLIEEEYMKAKNKAYQILSRAMQSEGQIRDKLKNKDFQDIIIDRVIDNLKEYRMINDEELAKVLARDRVKLKKYGQKRVEQILYTRKISKDIVKATMDELFSQDSELENAIYLAEKKIKKVKDNDERKAFQKVIQHLIYKGFSFDIAKKAANTVMKSDIE